MVKVWSSSTTFNHGFLIVPFSAFMIWQRRRELSVQDIRPSILGMTVLLISILIWYLSRLSSTQVGEHFGLVAIVCTGIWSVFGTEATKVIRFPLFFAFFAVPFGEFLIPPLMMWTADFTVWALSVTGVPVYLEGYYFSLPTGNFEVVEACSGVRYLIVTVVLGTFFTYEKFSTFSQRAAFVLFAALAMIAANGIRAYLVVLIAHLSNMRYGTGQDHVVLGWIVFLLAITLTFWIGARVSNKVSPNRHAVAGKIAVRSDAHASRPRHFISSLILTFLVIAIGPVLSWNAASHVTADWPRSYLPVPLSAWEGPRNTMLAYGPDISGAASTLSASYGGPTGSVDIHMLSFTEQRQGQELVRGDNKVFDPARWRLVERVESDEVTISDSKYIAIERALITDAQEEVVLLYWYDIGGWQTTSVVAAKIYHAVQELLGWSKGDAIIILATKSSEFTREESLSLLASFIHDHYSRLSDCMRVTSERPGQCAVVPTE